MVKTKGKKVTSENNLSPGIQGNLMGDNIDDKNDKSVYSAYIENTKQKLSQKTYHKTKKQWLWEFSKKIVVLVAIAFFIVLGYTLVFLIINPDSTAIQFLLDNVSDIFKVTVVSYAIKAGFENVIKIHKDDEEEV